jgi:hypothetical protein
VNLSILYAALSPPSRIVDLDENWDTQRWDAQPRLMRLRAVADSFPAFPCVVISAYDNLDY